MIREYKNGCNKILGNPMEIKYKNWKGNVSNRIIIPITIWYGISEFHDGNQWFLKAYDIDKLDTRDFAVKDILEYVNHKEDWYKQELKE